jgi:general secretion pathway protein H
MARRGTRPGAEGFTLIELLVVLAIIAALLTLAPAVMAGIPGFRLRAATAQLADTLRQLHDDALRTGAPTTFVLDAAHRRFATTAGTGEPVFQVLPEAVDAVALATASPLRPGAQQALTFFPDGSATGGTLRLLHGQHAASIDVDWLTGRVTADD